MIMNEIIIIITAVGVIIGFFIAIQTLINTRKMFYKEYIKRKRDGKN